MRIRSDQRGEKGDKIDDIKGDTRQIARENTSGCTKDDTRRDIK